MKTPEEIKKGLEICIGECVGNKPHCPYHECGNGCMDAMNLNSLAYIIDLEQRLAQAENTLEMQRAEREDTIKKHIDFVARIAQAERERDAAVHDVETLCLAEDFNGDYCEYCKHREPDGGCRHDCMPYNECGWEWRGVCEENSR